MLLSEVVLLVHVPLKSRENISLAQQVVATRALEREESLIRDTRGVRASFGPLRRECKVFELLAEDNDSLFCKEGVLTCRVGAGTVQQVCLCGEEARCGLGTVKCVRSMPEEGEDKVKAVGIKLGGVKRGEAGSQEPA